MLERTLKLATSPRRFVSHWCLQKAVLFFDAATGSGWDHGGGGGLCYTFDPATGAVIDGDKVCSCR